VITAYDIVMQEADKINLLPMKNKPDAVPALIAAAKRIREETNWLCEAGELR